ncbi:unnamed protein product [Rotaria sp. Silwood2]|nr:unnamed protein product [Rotaria sp. Silwood2]CAF2915119.1 unnamed protein product [Rotaria sp. Silwood2]CAF3049837.1 unnamed protein product [Rotaria sp. Silwood2]CAF3900412.1 unnamed protein product [Rotaria sp. Silwood2]CAF3967536.1 unnamed protein product [Rotaria sp. Silwood2]
MLSQPKSSNLSEALINVKKMENNFLSREFTFIDRERNKIRANVDRHMETFLQLTQKRHEIWYRHDKHFREALRKEKENHEKRKERNRQKLLLAGNSTYIPRVQIPFQPLITESIVLPPIATPTEATSTIEVTTIIEATPTTEAITTVETTITTETTGTTTEIPTANNSPTTKTKNNTSTTTPRAVPMTKVDRRTHQVLRASQKLLDESASRSRYKFVLDRPSSTSFNQKRPPPPPITTTSSSSCSFNSATLIVPMTTSIDCEEYNRLVNESMQQETFSELVDHFVKFRPEFREQFGLIHEASKRQKAMKKLREFNQIQARTKDERYHKLISSLTDLRSEQNEKLP